MSSIENQPTETDLNKETDGQLEKDQQPPNNKAQDRIDSVADGGSDSDGGNDGSDEGSDLQPDVAEKSNESQPSLEENANAQERLDSVADQPNRTEVVDATRIAHLNEARERFDGAPDMKEHFAEAAAQVPPDMNDHFSDASGDDDGEFLIVVDLEPDTPDSFEGPTNE